MQLPKRKSQMLKNRDDEEGPYLVTVSAKQKLERQLEDLEKIQRPKAVEDVARSVQLGDLSENAEYQEARHRLSRIDGQMFGIRERLKRAVIIQQNGNAEGRVQLGSRVTFMCADEQKTYDIVGPHESNPSQGKISHVSPLGMALMDHCVGDEVSIIGTQKIYRILHVV